MTNPSKHEKESEYCRPGRREGEDLKEAYERLKAISEWNNESIHNCLINMAQEKELKNGTVMWPVRIAAAGQTVTAGGAIEILDILGRDESLRRLEIGLEKLS